MEGLLRKYKQSIKAAEVLQYKHEFFASSVHCSYYSCMQLLLYVLYEHGVNERRIITGAKNTSGGTHIYASGLVAQLIEEERDSGMRSYFENTIEKLRNTRVKADYKSELINSVEGELAFMDALEINKILIETFYLNEIL